MNDTAPILCIVGARPNFMKIARLMPALAAGDDGLPVKLLHTGQHYDAAMKASFFEQLRIPEPDIDLGVGSGTHAEQTAQIMLKLEPVLDQMQPRALLVVGDVNSTIACALVAVKKGIPVIHVEAGLRSNDRAMPEEINRVLTDQISDLLFTTERSAEENLAREGVDRKRVHFVGNVMIDTLRHLLPEAATLEKITQHFSEPPPFSLQEKGYALVTLHRPSNVDDPAVLERLLTTLRTASQRIPLIFPAHPRTRGRIDAAGLSHLLENAPIWVLPPIGYLEMLGLMSRAKLVMSDSGGIQEETTALGIPCLTLRENTERPITISEGANQLVGSDPQKILTALDDTLTSGGKAGRIPEGWDGAASQRIAAVLKSWARGEEV
ncbi:non-hydrolyzing UDP-N-acetylglucosamine 2-epimerase [Magnetofaba australis]|uniref:Putative UDP-N-acetylglucosamine 2-epimerase n=1 Tax=Magnetofaba australis IT-1 TaxID=1434232 RepID=A0A1Y2K840_9PROT|nr:UDP-N-acetylglucosamine 2-epimerase (non-hydrolyzing) [Magnetofaba australis]OSM06842.1 putative UDP-N-acetylglucosamine 2-epimerase [Magnetofaba australis IT-1]